VNTLRKDVRDHKVYRGRSYSSTISINSFSVYHTVYSRNESRFLNFLMFFTNEAATATPSPPLYQPPKVVLTSHIHQCSFGYRVGAKPVR
jgi:hypothetical protein